jgi:hypothetical protein
MRSNLDLVRSIYVAWERGDFSRVEWADPSLELVSPDGPEAGCWVGVARAGEAWRNFLRAWEDLRAEAEAYREIDAGRVLVLLRNSGRARTSGVDVAQVRAGANLFHIHAGRVTRLVVYFERDRALADLGLAPDTGS